MGAIPRMGNVSGLDIAYSLVKEGGAVKLCASYGENSRVAVEFPAAEIGSDSELVAKAKPLLDMMIWDKLYGDQWDAQMEAEEAEAVK